MIQYDKFLKLLKEHEKFVFNMNDLDVFMENADKLIKDETVDVNKTAEIYEKGVEIEKHMEPYSDCFTAFFDKKHKNFKRMISVLGKKCGKIDEDKEDKISATTIAIIIIFSLLGVAIIVECGVYFYLKKRRLRVLPRE